MIIKRNTIPTLIGILVLFVGTFAGVFLLRSTQVFKIGASVTATPKDVRTGNITDTSATISWITADPTSAFISYGVSATSTNKVENESTSNEKFQTHLISLSGLSPSTTYYYKINSEGSDFDNNGVPWQFTTGRQLAGTANPLPISGSVITASGQPSGRSLVYVTIDGYLLSTLSSSEGNFVLQLGNARTSDLSGYAQINSAQTLLSVSVEAADGESSVAQIFPQSASPIPPLVLGQSKDYRGLPPNSTGQNPNANINLPTGTESSKFNVSTPSGSPSPTSVILESLTEGETVTSTQPQFFGKGPGGRKNYYHCKLSNTHNRNGNNSKKRILELVAANKSC